MKKRLELGVLLVYLLATSGLVFAHGGGASGGNSGPASGHGHWPHGGTTAPTPPKVPR